MAEENHQLDVSMATPTLKPLEELNKQTEFENLKVNERFEFLLQSRQLMSREEADLLVREFNRATDDYKYQLKRKIIKKKAGELALQPSIVNLIC